LIIDADDDESNGGAFALGKQVIAGAYEYALYYDAAAFAWYLQSSYFTEAGEYAALVTGALMGWHAEIPALHNRLHDLRWTMDDEALAIEPAAWTGSSARGAGPWLHVTNANQEIGAGMPFDQQVQKLEAGIDGRIDGAKGERYLIGAFAGTGQTEQDFEASASATHSTVLLAGLYGGYVNGGFYADALMKYEHQTSAFKGEATLNEEAAYRVDLLGGSFKAGYRFASEHAYFEPGARLAYVHAWTGSFEDGSAETVDLKNAESLVGELSARLGVRLPHILTDFHVDAGMRHEFFGETEAEVSGLSYTHELPGTVGFISTGLTMTLMEDKLSLVLESGYAKGEHAEEITATGALRINY
jgi:outer membrane autotransporter protein